jgi:hypothetical protein
MAALRFSGTLAPFDPALLALAPQQQETLQGFARA